MSTTLLRRFFGSILLLALLVLGARPAQATHFLGGEMSYRYLDATGPTGTPFRYEITVTLYINALPGTPGQPQSSQQIRLYNRTTGAAISQVTLQGTISPPISGPPIPVGCNIITPNQPFIINRFVGIVNLPVSFDGYYAVFSVAARNNDLTNINNTNNGPNQGNVPLTLYVSMAPPLIFNRSPVFSDTAVAIICRNDTTISLNNAVDPDGDRLVYSFGTPYGTLANGGNDFVNLPNSVPYYAGYSGANPLGTGAGNFALINASTGVARYGSTNNSGVGKFVVAVDVSEYRDINGTQVLLGTTRRDIQLIVATCPATPPPVLPSTVNTPRNYTIEEGQALSIPISVSQSSGGHPLVLTANSALLDGSGPFNTTFNGSTGTVVPGNLTGTATATGTGSVNGTFVFNSVCGNARATPYDIAITVKDNGCGGKVVADLFRVTVTRAAGPNAITGPTTVCDPATARTYTAAGPVPVSYRWRITGGTISSGQGTNTVQVRWASTNTTGTLSLKGISTYGCSSDSVIKTVDIRPLPALTAAAAAPSVCQGTSTTLTVTGQTGLTYVWTGGGISSTTATVTVTPTATTTYTVTGTDGTCTTTATVTVTVTAPPTANAGPDRTVCPNVTSTPLGVAAVTGFTYAWTPAVGLSSTTVAQPTVSLPNTTGAAIIRTYTLTVSSGPSCLSRDSVEVTVSPAALADAGPALSTCSGVASATIGTPALPGYTYSWTPSVGLSSTTAAQPTATQTSSIAVPFSTFYTVTATTSAGCSATSVVQVTFNPAAVATPGPAISFCSGTVSAPLGGPATPVAGTIYSWTPTTGLSNPNILNPTVTGTNTTGVPITTTYTLTATTANGCAATATVAVTINPAAVADAGPARSTCSNVPVAIGSAPLAGYTYSWSLPSGLSSTTVANPTVTLPNTTGTPINQTYTVTATTASGCTATSTVTVTINPAAVAQAGPAVAFCSGETRTLGAGTAIAGTTYAWSPTTGLSSSTVLSPTLTLTNTTGAPITTTYTLTATTAQGCTATSTVTITVNQAAVAQAGPAVTFCSGETRTLGAGTAVTGTTYSWSPTTGLSSSTVLSPTLTLTNTTGAPITTTYTLTATTAQGCAATSTVTITVNQAAVAQAGPAVTFCSGETRTLGTGNAVTGTTYSWSPTTGLSDPTVLSPTVTLTNTTGAPITQTYTLTATTAQGCAATSTVTITVNQAAVAQAGPAVVFCSGEIRTLGAGTAVAGTTYAWSPTTGLSSATVLSPTVTLTNTTGAPITQTYTLTATTTQGCTATSTVAVTVNQAAVAQAGPTVTFCSGETRTLGAGTAVAGTTYAWTPTTGLSSATTLSPTLTLTNTTGAPITATYTLTATTTQGCTATSTVVVTVNQAAVAQAGPDKATCSNVSTTIGTGTAVVGTTYAWTPTTGLSSATALTPTLTLPNLTAAAIVTTYTLTATTAQGCTATSTVAVTVNQAAVAQAGPDKATCSNVSTTIGTGTAVVGTTYAWSPATGLSSASVLTPTVTLPNLTGTNIAQQYILLATTANGCFQRDTVVVTINPAAVAVAGTSQAVCSDLPITLGAAPVAGSTYSWSPATGLSSATVANPTFALTNPTTTPNPITFTLTATTANGCVATSTVTVTVNPAAVAQAGPDAAVCDLKTLTLGTPALAGYTYSWAPATGLSSATAAQAVFTASNTTALPITRTYTLTATTANGCVSTDAVAVTIDPRPLPSTIVGPASVCPTVTGIAYSVVNPVGTDFTWQINGGTIVSGQGTPAITVDWGVASVGGYLKVFSLNAQGCSSDTTTLPIIINPTLRTVRPTGPGDALAVAPLPRAVCQADGPYRYVSGAFANGSSYAWTIVGGTQVSTLQNTVTVNWDPVTVPTIGKIVVTETSNPASGVRCLGTSDTLFVNINPSPRPTLAITAPVRVCQTNGPVTFGLPGGFAGSSYVFQLNGATLAGTGNTRVLSPLPAPGTYPLTVQETTSAGCTGPLYTTSFTVAPTPAAPVISGSGFVCNVATPQPYAIANPTAGASYEWTVVGGAITTGGTGSQITVRFNPTGPYSVSAAEISAAPASCTGPATTRTILFDSPTLVLANASVDIASNSRVIISLSVPNSGNTPNPVQVLRRVAGSGTFAPVGTVAASATTFTDNSAVDANANSYEYQLSLTNGCGTVNTTGVAQTIRLQATATATAGGRDQGRTALTWNAFAGFTVKEYRIFRRSDAGTPVLIATVGAGTLQYAASNNDPTAPATGLGFSQNFRVVAVSTDATPLLSNSNETSVSFANAVKTYNVITPNRDGLNDVLVIDNISLYPGNTFTIFNRWGREVYKTTNYQNNWGSDDTIAAGNYFYILTLPNGTSTRNWFEVIK